MAIIEPLRHDAKEPQRIQKHSSPIRLWHWLNALIITGSLLMVLINSTLLDVHDNTLFVKNQLVKSGAAVSDVQARNVAHALEDNAWVIHIYIGYFLTGCLVFRLLLEVFQKREQKFIGKFIEAYRTYRSKENERTLAQHELTVKALYIFFYLLLAIMVITGLTLAFDHELGIGKSIGHSIKEVHGFCMYLIIAFIVVHVAGVVMPERKEGQGYCVGYDQWRRSRSTQISYAPGKTRYEFRSYP